MPIGLYIHFPFCRRKCFYCDFHSVAGRDDWMRPYIDALCAEARRASPALKNISIDTVYLGGGTPTLFPPEDIFKVLQTCHESFHIAPDAEISIEANPATVDADSLAQLRNAGINRISIGAQSFSDALLGTLGRIHQSGDIHAAVRSAAGAGFDNINIDLIYGIPGQTMDDWRDTLEKAISLPITHISAYALKIEPGTPFYARRQTGTLALPGEDAELAMQDAAIEALAAAGFDRYEISNYAKPGYACRHNLHYWRYDAYLALGSGACGRLGPVRYTGAEDITGYIGLVGAGLPAFSRREILAPDTQVREAVMMGLRLTEGISYQDFSERFGVDLRERYGDAISRLCGQGLGVSDSAGFRLTKRGMDVQNQALLHFIE
jgi:oxygen-independent coproporphyrinogen-3 oxidase